MANNTNTQKSTSYTQVNNAVLTDIFGKGLLTYDEIRIVSVILRWSWGFHQEQTIKSFTVTEIAKATNMKRSTCSRAINKMIRENKLKREKGLYQFNKKIEEWKTKSVAQSYGVKTDNVPEKRSTELRKAYHKATLSVAQSYGVGVSSSDKQGTADTPKESIKENINKDKEKRIKEKKNHTQPKREITFNKKTLQFEGITENDIKKWAEAYPEIDIQLEIKRMLVYLEGRRDKQNKKLWRKFITGWLSREVKGYKNNHKKGERYHGITTRLTEEEKRRIKEDEKNGITSWKAGEW